MALTKVPLSLLDSPGTSGNVLTSDGTSWVSQTPATPAGVPTGGIIYWPSTTPPSGYLKCDGSIYNRSSYSSLASVVGTPMLPSSETLRNSGLAIGSGLGYPNYITSVNGVIFTSGSAGLTTSSVANGFRTSTDGITFTSRTGAGIYTFQGTVAYFASTYVTLVSYGATNSATSNFQTSTDLATWTQRTFTAATLSGGQLALAGNQTWGRGIMHNGTTGWDGCGYVISNPYTWYYSTNATTWTAAASPPTNTQGFSAHHVVAGTASALALYGASGTGFALWYTADGSTYTNVTSNITSSFPNVTTVYKVFWTGTYFYLLCNSNIVLRSTTGASGTWSQATNMLGIGNGGTNTFSSMSSDSYIYSTDGTYHIMSAGTGAFWYSSDLVNWSYISGRSGFYAAVTGSTFVGRTASGPISTYTMTGTGYTTATQFPVPNLNLASANPGGTFAPPPVAYIKT
jgi:hypothetical protein